MIRSNRGVALATLVIAVLIMLTITGTITYTSLDTMKLRKLDDMYNDISLLNQKIINYHIENNSLPVLDMSIEKSELEGIETNINDNNMYYIIDLEKLGGITLKNGKDYSYYKENSNYNEDKKDVYIINDVSHTIYYLKGIEINSEGININKHTLEDLEENYSEIEKGVIIPKGFEYVEGTKDTGVVIRNKEDGNEFVWVPVDKPIYEETDNPTGMFSYDIATKNYTGNLYDWLQTGEIVKNTSYKEPYNLNNQYDNIDNLPAWTDNLFQTEYNNMAKSIQKYGGFYVGRYETGGFNSDKVVSKQGEGINSCRTKWYTAYTMQKNLYSTSDSVVSGMIYGSQWDAIMNWMKEEDNPNIENGKYILNSVGMGNFNGSYQNTGYYKVKNIYDLAGNHYEWTQEAVLDPNDTRARGIRGYYAYGGDSNNFRASFRTNDTVSTTYNYSSRLMLYIK